LVIICGELTLNEILINKCKGKNFFVTGGAGFIGSEVVRQISKSSGKVIVYDNFSSGKRKYLNNLANVKIIKGDIKNRKLLAKATKNCQYFINLAALPFIPDSYHYPQEFFEINTNGTINVILEAVKQKKIKSFVHISTSEVYGTARKNPMDENHPTLPHSTYAVSKLAGDRAVFTLHKEHDVPAVIIRPFNCFGPRVTQPYIIPEIITQIIHDKKTLNLGNIESKRDFTYVSDTARGIITALFSDKAIGETINLGTGKTWKIKQIGKELLPYISERNKEKVGLRTLGTDIEIISEEEARKQNPSAMLVIPWNFKEEIVNREQQYIKNGGKLLFIMPYPYYIDKNGETKL